MLARLTIRQRILITFTFIVIMGSLIQLFIAGRQLEQATLEFYQHHIETDALMIASTLSEPLEKYEDGDGTQDIQRMLGNIQPDTGYNYLVVDRNFRIIAYTANTGYESLARVPITPELSTAQSGQLGADTRIGYGGNTYIFVAIAIQYEGEMLGYLVLSRPQAPAYVDVYQQWFQLASTTLPVIAMVIVMSLWLSASISQPLQALRNSAMKMAEGDFNTRIVSQSQDEVGQLAQAFNYMAGQIEGLLQNQRSFVSNAAHELRTPLMTLKLRAEALEDGALSADERTQYLHEIHAEINHMSALVSSLLILARVDDDRHQHHGHMTDTTATLRDLTRLWRATASQNPQITFKTEIPADLPYLPLSSNDMRLIIDNLLGNAIKYTPAGEVTMSVTHTPRQFMMRICDSGIGATPEQLSQLFTRFYRADDVRIQFEGNGLGLSIVQAILKQYNATITADSAGVGQGLAVTVAIPL